MAEIMPAPVRKSVVVRAPVERAFDVFTAGISRWWFKTHKIGPAPLKEVVMEGRAGGRWYERDEDGSECDWGRVLVWEPPKRLVLAWQIDADFKYDPGLVTEVEVTFAAVGANETRVALEHRHLERVGERAEWLRTQLDGGWTPLLESFANLCHEADR
jgi:uncharacterized protein YndB with AHSA1/START domain